MIDTIRTDQGNVREFVDLAGGGGGGGGGGEMLKAERRITSEELLDLSSSPVELVAGEPGVVFLPLAAMVMYRPGSTPYTDMDYLNFGVSTNYPVVTVGGNVLAGDAQLGWGVPGGGSYGDYGDYYVGEPLILWDDTSPAEGDGELDVAVWYTRWAIPA